MLQAQEDKNNLNHFRVGPEYKLIIFSNSFLKITKDHSKQNR